MIPAGSGARPATPTARANPKHHFGTEGSQAESSTSSVTTTSSATFNCPSISE